MKKETEKKPAAKAGPQATPKAAPAKMKDLQPKKDAKGGRFNPPPMWNHNETLVCD
jgi:hypothetical protein